MRHSSLLLCAAVSGLAGICQAGTILIDFGDVNSRTTALDSQGRRWNNVVDTSQPQVASPMGLLLTDNSNSGVTLTMAAAGTVIGSPLGFCFANTSGTNSPTDDALSRAYPASATRDSLYGSASVFSGMAASQTILTLSGLEDSTPYTFYFFASRTGVSDNRETEYRVDGAGDATSAFLNASNNTGNIVSVANVTPENGIITVTVLAGPNNTNSVKFDHLGVMEVVAVPEPTSLALVGFAGAALLRRRSRSRRPAEAGH